MPSNLSSSSSTGNCLTFNGPWAVDLFIGMLVDVDDVGTVVVELLLTEFIGADPPCVEAEGVGNAPP